MKGSKSEQTVFSGFIAIIPVVAIQILLFHFAWQWLVGEAIESGRTAHVSISFGITLHYGAMLLGYLILVASGISIFAKTRAFRWKVIAAFLLVWLWWNAPSVPNYPIRSSAHFLLGSLILVTGSGILAPLAARAISAAGERFTRPN